MRCIASLLLLLAIGCSGEAPVSPAPTSAPRPEAAGTALVAENARLRQKLADVSSELQTTMESAKQAAARARSLEAAIVFAQRQAVGRYIDAADKDRYLRSLGAIPKSQWPRLRPLAEAAAAGELLTHDQWLRLNKFLTAHGQAPLWIAAATDWSDVPAGLRPEPARIAAAQKYLAAKSDDERAAAQFEAHAAMIEDAAVIQPASALAR